jgi:GTP cyclohydrolase I
LSTSPDNLQACRAQAPLPAQRPATRRRTGRAKTGASDDPRPTDVKLNGVSGVDAARAEAAVRELLLAIGEDPYREGLLDTPARVARAYQEVLAGLFTDPADVLQTTFEEGHDELVLVKDIPLYSVCEHHLVPWHGSAAVGYIPGSSGRVVGLSKLARLVDLYAKRLQLQERLTVQVADAVQSRLEAAGVVVVVQGQHLCMAMRGIRKPGSVTVTSAVRGVFKTDGCTRAEVMGLVLGR